MLFCVTNVEAVVKLVSAQRGDDIQARLRSGFAEFNRTSSPSKGRRYPADLQALVRKASAEGVELSTLGKLTGVSSTALARWCKAAQPLTSRRQPKAAQPRRLEVVGSDTDQRGRPVVIRLPSGVSIELGDGAALGGELLAALATLGGGHATSR